jgi:hypothetical protein
MNDELLVALDRDLWVASRPLRLWVGDVGTRMSIIRLKGGELLLHSPVTLDAETRRALDDLGVVRWIVGPNKAHHFYLGDCARAYSSAALYGAPGLPEKRRDLRFDAVLEEEIADRWGGEVLLHLFRGAPLLNEVVFFHPSTRTLLLTDLAFNVCEGGRNRARLFHWLVGATGRFGPHRLVRAVIRDHEAARRSLETILGWDFERVIVTHGEVLESGGRRCLEDAFSYLSASKA